VDVTLLIQHAVAALLGGGSSAVALLSKHSGLKSDLDSKIDDLKDDFKKIKSKIDEFKEEFISKSLIDDWKRSVIQGMRLEFDNLKGEVDLKFERQLRSSHPDMTEDLHRKIEKVSRDLNRFVEEYNAQRYVPQRDFNEFSKEQERQWKDLNFMLGEIRGSRRRKTDSEKP
jgi:archaellum component FlaC